MDINSKHYMVIETRTGQQWGQLTTDVKAAKAVSAELNNNMKPEYQTYTVATVIFDPEV